MFICADLFYYISYVRDDLSFWFRHCSHVLFLHILFVSVLHFCESHKVSFFVVLIGWPFRGPLRAPGVPPSDSADHMLFMCGMKPNIRIL